MNILMMDNIKLEISFFKHQQRHFWWKSERDIAIVAILEHLPKEEEIETVKQVHKFIKGYLKSNRISTYTTRIYFAPLRGDDIVYEIDAHNRIKLT